MEQFTVREYIFREIGFRGVLKQEIVGEIVRCRECKHRDAETGFCEGRGIPMQLVPCYGFCDKGERREDVEETD